MIAEKRDRKPDLTQTLAVNLFLTVVRIHTPFFIFI